MAAEAVELEVGGRTVRITNPDRVYFPARGETKLDLARYYMSVGDGIVRALRERPCMMHRFPSGVAGGGGGGGGGKGGGRGQVGQGGGIDPNRVDDAFRSVQDYVRKQMKASA